MQASPSFSIVLERFGLWRLATAVLLLLSTASVLAWLWSALSLDGTTIATAALAVLAIAVATWATRPPGPMLLRWDGRRWLVGPAAAAGSEPRPAELTVAIDLGGWMLLRLRREGVPRWRATAWLPAQKRGHEAQWHALRCAVYSPRPAPGGPSEADL